MKFRHAATSLILFFSLFLAMIHNTAYSKDLKSISEGEDLNIAFTCRARGEVAATTLAATAQNPNEKKSGMFLDTLTGRPVQIKTARKAPVMSQVADWSLEEEIKNRLAKSLIGLEKGVAYRITLESELAKEKIKGERFLELATFEPITKIVAMSREAVQKEMGRIPEVGEDISKELSFLPHLPARKIVTNVSDEGVSFRIELTPGRRIMRPIGPGTVIEEEDQYKIKFDFKTGDFYRVGPAVGRVVDIDEQNEMMLIDFAHPFGGDILTCDVIADTDSLDDKTVAHLYEDPIAVTAKAAVEASPGSQGKSEDPEKKAAMVQLRTAVENARSQGITTINMNLAEDGSKVAAQGDLGLIDYVLRTDSGTLVATTIESVGAGNDAAWDPAVTGRPESFGPVELLVGLESPVPGVAQTLIGMSPGQTRKVELTAENAFGLHQEHGLVTLPRIKKFKTTAVLTAQQYVTHYGEFPVFGKQVNFTPYFDSRVTAVDERSVTLTHLVRDGHKVKDAMGVTTIRVEGEDVILTLSPTIGAFFPINKRAGRIVSMDEESFIVDTNHPLAGKPMTLEITLNQLIKAETFKDDTISWLEDHELGTDRARMENKPMVLVLYASWCQWSKKLLDQALTDPRITRFKDRFIWTKIDSDAHREYKEGYEQEGYPMILILGPDGDILEKMEGYNHPSIIKRMLEKYLQPA